VLELDHCTESLMSAKRLVIVVGIATAGRREVLARTIELLARQTRLPDYLIICPASSADVDAAALSKLPMPATVVSGPLGSCSQRNAILSSMPDADVVVFFDDDFLADQNYIANLEALFVSHDDVVAATGTLLADGVHGPGLNVQEGETILDAPSSPVDSAELNETYGAYGCNMAFRVAPVRQNRVCFDESLPLYGWQEDIDFSRTLARFGRVVRSSTLRGVHLGVKRGRTSGVRFGYSQVANPFYLIEKGTMSWQYGIPIVWRNLAANLLYSFRPEPWIDRRGRLKGNFIALKDALLGRISPDRILQL